MLEDNVRPEFHIKILTLKELALGKLNVRIICRFVSYRVTVIPKNDLQIQKVLFTSACVPDPQKISVPQ